MAVRTDTGMDVMDATGAGFTVTASGVGDYASSPDESQLALAGDELSLWDLKAGKLIHSWPGSASSIVFSGDGKHLAAGLDGVSVFDTASGKTLFHTTYEGPVNEIVLNQDGTEVIIMSNYVDVSGWLVPSGAKIANGSAQTGATFGMDLSSDGRWAAAAAPDGHGLQVFDVHAWGPRQLIDNVSCQEHLSVSFTRNSKLVHGHGGLRWIKAFEVGTWRPYASYHASPGRVVYAAADDMSRVVVADEKTGEAWVVTVETRAEVKLEKPFSAETYYFMSSDGLHVSSGDDNTMRIWSAKTGKIVYEVHS